MKAKDRKPLLRWKVKLRITARVKSRSGFAVRGPDDKLHIAPTKKEAFANLKARMACTEMPAWSIQPATEADKKEEANRLAIFLIDNDNGD
jgi:hypothetical protein